MPLSKNHNTEKIVDILLIEKYGLSPILPSRVTILILNKLYSTRKYPLRGYILGVLTHTTSWDQLWGGDVSLRLYKRSSASLHLAAVVFWKSDHEFLKSSTRRSTSPCSVAA